jgi:hypothetical protein
MNFDTAFRAGDTIAELANDVYTNIERFAAEQIVLSYRASVSDFDANVDVNTHFHVVMNKRGKVWYTLSDDAFPKHDDLVFNTDDDDPSIRARSYRRYIFTDLFEDAVTGKLQSIMLGMKNPQQIYLWDTFPVKNFKGLV